MAPDETTNAAADPMAGLSAAPASWVKWGKPGDWVRGTLADVREMESTFADRPGEMVKVYEFVASGGSFHNFKKENGVVNIDEQPTILEKGAIWLIGGKTAIDNQMRNVKIGQIFGMRFAEEKPNRKNPSFSPTKVVNVLVGEMDPEYQGQTSADQTF